jgi:hypothetical protein
LLASPCQADVKIEPVEPFCKPERKTAVSKRWKLILAFTIAACLTSASQVIAVPPWTDPRYLYRYVFWGIPSELSKSDDWKLFPYHTIENAPRAFRFSAGPAAKDGGVSRG